MFSFLEASKNYITHEPQQLDPFRLNQSDENKTETFFNEFNPQSAQNPK